MKKHTSAKAPANQYIDRYNRRNGSSKKEFKNILKIKNGGKSCLFKPKEFTNRPATTDSVF